MAAILKIQNGGRYNSQITCLHFLYDSNNKKLSIHQISCFYDNLNNIATNRSTNGEQAGPSCAPLGPLPGTFLGPALDVRSESLYELALDIPDFIGLRVLRPDVAAVKVMSVRNSQCIRVVTPNDHVTCGYHEILLHNMGEEELPFVSLSELDYLHHIWPQAVFAFMTRYQQDLERKRKECKDRFGCTQSGNCTHCGKYIQMDLGTFDDICISGVVIDMLLFS